MTERRSSINVEVLLYVVVILAAAWMRLMHLGAHPLSVEESKHALAAASVSSYASSYWNEGAIATPRNPAYHNFTAPLFQMVGANETSARWISALAGIALVVTPIFARRRLGRANALCLATIFAFSPVLVASSRTAGGQALATFGILAVLMLLIGADSGAEYQKRLPWVAGLVGFSLATGADVLFGLSTLCLSAVLLLPHKPYFKAFMNSLDRKRAYQYAWIAALVWVGVVTGLGFSLSGIVGISESAGVWLSGWFNRGELSGLTSLAMIPLYEPLVLFFGIVGIVRTIQKPDWLLRGAAIWFGTSLIVNLVYPARKPSDLTWVVIPLAFFAARELTALVSRVAKRRTWFEFFGLSTVLALLGAFDLNILESYAQGATLIVGEKVLDPRLYLVVIFGMLIIAVMIVVLFAYGWDERTSLDASGSIVAVFLVLLTISATWRLNFTPAAASARELWRPKSPTQSIFTLRSTIHSISQGNTGRKDGLSLQVYHGAERAEIAWAMREFNSADDLSEDPALILAPASVDLNHYLGDYIGQSFNLVEYWDWGGFLPPEPVKWWAKREAPVLQEWWLLLARADLIRGGEQSISSPLPHEVDDISK